MTGAEIRRRWVVGQKDFKLADSAVKAIESEPLDLPDPESYADPMRFWDAVAEVEQARDQKMNAATNARLLVRTRLEQLFDTKCEAKLRHEKALNERTRPR